MAHEIPISGYVGLMTFEGSSPDYGLSIYCMTDFSHTTLIIMPLTFGFLKEAYDIAKLPTYQTIIILMPTINNTMCSELYSLVRLLIAKKGIKHVKWVNPDTMLEWATSTFMIDTQIKANELDLTEYGKFSHMCPYIKFIPSGTIPLGGTFEIYDIAIWDGAVYRYFMNIIRIQALSDLMPNPNSLRNPPEIHLPYQPSWYGITGYDLFKDIDKVNKSRSQVLLDSLQTEYWELQRYNYNDLAQYTSEEIESLHEAVKLEAFDKMRRKTSFTYHSFPSHEILEEMIVTYGILVGRMAYDDFI